MKKMTTILGSIIAGLAVGTMATAQTYQDTTQQVGVEGPDLVATDGSVGTTATTQTNPATTQQGGVEGSGSVTTGGPVGPTETVQTHKGSDRQVVVLDLMLYAERGRTIAGDVASARRIDSFAPKVFARKGGDWKVLLLGDREASFTINDPASDVEIENPRGSKSPFSEVAMSGSFSSTLVVPLYGLQGEWLGAQEIEIVDMRTNKTILWTSIP